MPSEYFMLQQYLKNVGEGLLHACISSNSLDHRLQFLFKYKSIFESCLLPAYKTSQTMWNSASASFFNTGFAILHADNKRYLVCHYILHARFNMLIVFHSLPFVPLRFPQVSPRANVL
jgi:hypothetical protein